jgi:membrane protease YdiL (CAAX protease family)
MSGYLKWMIVPVLLSVHMLGGGTLNTLLYFPAPWHALEPNITRDLTVGLLVGMIYVAISRWLIHSTDWGRALEDELLALLKTRERAPFKDALTSSVVEEVAFRAILLNHIGIWLGAGLFALFHIPTRIGLIPWMLSAFLMGVVFGALFVAGFSLIAPFMAHFTINYVNLHYLNRRQHHH